MIIKDILDSIEYVSFVGDASRYVDKPISLNEIDTKTNALSWCNDSNIDKLKEINSSSLVIVSDLNNEFGNLKNYIVVKNPRRTFQEILTKFFEVKREIEISKSANIDHTSIIGENVFIGHNVVIEENCKVGDFSVILHNTIILKDTIIGKKVTIGSNNTIGGVGFGYEKNNNGDFELIPHIGNVVIKNNVDIGNNTCIDRAVLGSTILEENVKIDNLVHIAHGVKVGRNSVVIANAMVAGSVNIGVNSWIAPSASILNKRDVGDNSLVGLGAVVTKNVEDFTIVAGNPAKFIRNLK